jgi:predicted phage gp36 major capsid-like protein
MHRIREHIIHAIGRDPKRIYGERRLNPDVQTAVEKSAEVMIGIQKIRKDITKLKDIIHTIVEETEEDLDAEADADAERASPDEREERGDRDDDEARNLERRRRQMKFMKRLALILRL